MGAWSCRAPMGLNPASATEQAGNMTALRVEVLDSGHLIAMERPREFNRLLEEFIDSRPELRNPRSRPRLVRKRT